jgi:hypothetical protein
MKKLNSYALAMLQKYGSEWDTPLFKKRRPKKSVMPKRLLSLSKYEPACPAYLAGESQESVIPVCLKPESASLYIDDSTEHKASIYDKLDAEKQMLKVFEIIEELGGTATDNSIARKMNIQPSTVSARRNELRDRGLVVPLLDFYGKKVKKRDHITGQLNTVWKINK